MNTISNNIKSTAANSVAVKGIFLSIVLSVAMLFASSDVKATHASGADISYQCLGGNDSFRVEVAFYRACSGIGAPPNVTVTVSSASCGQSFTVTAFQDGPGVEIIPYCAAEQPTQCAGGPVTRNAREQYLYVDTLTLPAVCTDWTFSYSICCRNGGPPPDGITNILAPGSENIYVEAKLDNSVFPCNSSPIFTNPPAPFVYTGATVCYNNGAVDLDGDSLVYTMVTPKTGPSSQVTYNFPFTNLQPLSSSPAVTINPTTGDICMTPTVGSEVTVLAVLVEEYRFGTLIGSVLRDIQVNVIPLPDVDLLPVTNGINGTGTFTDTIAAGCAFNFTTSGSDADVGDTLSLFSNIAAAIPGASFIIAGNGTPTPTGTFSWTPGPGDISNTPHCFVTGLYDDACPINGSEIRAWCFKVIEFSALFTNTGPACIGDSMNFYSQYNYSGYSYVWDFGAGSIATLPMATSPNPVGVVYSTAGTKTVILTITSPTGCIIQDTNIMTVNPVPSAAFSSTGTSMSKCAGDTVSFMNLGSSGPSVTHAWDFGLLGFPASSNIESPAPIIYLANAPITTTHTVTNQFGCISTDTVNFTINEMPVADFSSNAPSCTGSSVDFANTGTTGASYFWDFGSGATPATSTAENPTGVTYTTLGGDIKTVYLITTLGSCSDSMAQTINVFETPAPSFTTTGAMSKCEGDTVSFNYTGTTGIGWTYDWDFGVVAFPSSSNAQNPSFVLYAGAAMQNVSLTVTNGACSDTTSVSFAINQMPVADFASNAPSCTGSSIDFVNMGTTGATYFWNFGSGATPATSTAENPTGVTYTTLGGDIKTVYLITTLGSCSDSMAQTINVFETPVPSFTHDGPACEEDELVTFTYTGTTGTGWTYDWDFGVVAFPSSSSAENPSPVMYLGASTKTVTLTVTNGSCSDTVSASVVINETPVADFSSNAPSCTGDSVYFINTGTTGATAYAWNFGSGATPGTSTLENPLVVEYDTTGGDIKTIQLTTTLGACADSISKTINITETPAPAFTHDASPNACEGATVTFTYTGTTDPGWTYAWDFGAGAAPATSTAEDSIEVTYTGTGAKIVTLTVTGVCSESTTSNSIIIVQTPVADFSSTGPACTGDLVDFMNTGTTGAGYAWTFGTGSAPASSALESPTNISYGSAGLKSVMLVTTIGSCTDTSTQTVNLIQIPAPAFINDGPKCEGEEFTFTYIGSTGIGWTYAWDFGAGSTPNTSTAGLTATTMYMGTGGKTVSLTVTNDICSSTSTSGVTVNETPVASFASTAPACTGDSVDFTNTGSTGGTWTYGWNFDSGSTPSTSSDENPISIVYSTDGTKLVTLIISSATCADTTMMPVDINLRPTATFASTAPQCAEENVDFGNTGSTGSNWNYIWDFGGNANPTTSNAENPTDITFETGGVQTISFTISDQYCTETFTNTISIYSLPTADAGSDTVICSNASVSIGTTSTVGYVYNWTQTSTLSSGSSSNPTASPTAPVTTYIVMVTDANGCVNEDSVIVTMLQSAVVNAGPDAEICWGDTVQIGNGLLLGQTYSWSPQAGLDNPSISSPMASPLTSTTYTVTVSFENCPPLTDEVYAEVHPLPDAKATDYLLQDTTYITLGNSILLIATGGLQFSWLPESGLSNAGLYNPVATPDSTTNYSVKVVDIYGCVNWDTVRVDVDSVNFWVPTAFTPDGNGFNDVFMIRIEDMETFELIIFDRWGEQVFISRDASLGWEGLNQTSGDKMPQGAYVYSFKGTDIDGEAVSQSGLVNLIR